MWLNPPYSRALLSPFVDKLVSEWASGAIEQAIMITHNYTDTAWFHAAANASRAFCFLLPVASGFSPRLAMCARRRKARRSSISAQTTKHFCRVFGSHRPRG